MIRQRKLVPRASSSEEQMTRRYTGLRNREIFSTERPSNAPSGEKSKMLETRRRVRGR